MRKLDFNRQWFDSLPRTVRGLARFCYFDPVMDFIAYVFLVFIIRGLISLDSKIRRNYFKLVQLVDFVISLKDVCDRSLLILHYFSCLLFKY